MTTTHYSTRDEAIAREIADYLDVSQHTPHGTSWAIVEEGEL